jgi:hypothetical protein
LDKGNISYKFLIKRLHKTCYYNNFNLINKEEALSLLYNFYPDIFNGRDDFVICLSSLLIEMNYLLDSDLSLDKKKQFLNVIYEHKIVLIERTKQDINPREILISLFNSLSRF